MILITILLLIGISLLALQFAIWIVYGGFAKDSEWIDKLKRQSDKGCSRNTYSDDILQLGVGESIIVTRHYLDIFSRYNIQNFDVRIPRFSKCDKMINELFKNTPSEKQKQFENL